MQEEERDGDERAGGARTARLARWKKALVALSLALAAVGGGFWAYGQGAAPQPAAKAPTPAPSRGLAPGENGDSPFPELPRLPGEDGGGSSERVESPSPNGGQRPLWPAALFRLGAGFFAGFCVGYAARVFLRITLVVAGLLLLALLGLQYAGLIAVDWGALEGGLADLGAWLRANLAGFRAFVAGAVPSAAAGIGGVVVGFRK